MKSSNTSEGCGPKEEEEDINFRISLLLEPKSLLVYSKQFHRKQDEPY